MPTAILGKLGLIGNFSLFKMKQVDQIQNSWSVKKATNAILAKMFFFNARCR